MNGERTLCGERSSLQTTGRKLEDLSLNQFLVETKRGYSNKDEIQVEKTTTLAMEPELHEETGILANDDINMSQPNEGIDPDDMPPVSAKMAVVQSREKRAKCTIVPDSSDEEDNNLDRSDNGYCPGEQQRPPASGMVEPPRVRYQGRRRVPIRQGQDFEDQTCDLLRKAEEQTIRSRLELEEYLREAGPLAAGWVSGGTGGLQSRSIRRNVVQIRQLKHCLSRWGIEGLTDDQTQRYSDLGSKWMRSGSGPTTSGDRLS
jgi:hypothetical protein